MYNLNIAIAALYAEVVCIVCIVYSTSVVVAQEKLSFGSSSITTRILWYKSLN